MRKEDCYFLGRITRKHGLSGNVILKLDTDQPDFYKKLESIFVEINGLLVPFFIEKVIWYKQVNLSGNAVKFWLQKENIPIENLMIITDDLALPFGTLRMKGKGSDAGHNGLKNIQNMLQTQAYPRLRFGISADFMKGQQIDYVLGEWTEEEEEKLPERINTFAEACLSFTFAGITNTMNSFNGK